MNNRLLKVFSSKNKKLVTFVTGGDPDLSTSKKIIKRISNTGADIIEIGMPFSDPMADGPTIQLSSNRSIQKGVGLNDIFLLCKNFRESNNFTPIILMGYYNVILYYGLKKFVNSCKKNGIDGLIVVDLQPEEDTELFDLLQNNNIDLIRLITPTTNKKRLKSIIKYASGFLYYVTITGITGQKSANIKELNSFVKKIRENSKLPILCGFGIKNRKQVSEICKVSDGVVVGSSIVKIIEQNLNNKNKMISKITKFVKDLKLGTNI